MILFLCVLRLLGVGGLLFYSIIVSYIPVGLGECWFEFGLWFG